MSSLLRPVGPQPPGVYWVRRLLLLLVVLLVLGLVWWLFLKPSSGSPATPTGAATPSLTPSASSTSPSLSPSPSLTPSTTPSSSSTLPPCRSSEVTVTVTTDRQRYGADEQPSFTLGVQNDSDVTCLRDVGQAALELQVTAADGTPVWSSDDCNPGGEPGLRTFGPGDRWVVVVDWSRQESAEGCPSGEPLAPAGEYEVIGRNLAVLSEPAAFTLR